MIRISQSKEWKSDLSNTISKKNIKMQVWGSIIQKALQEIWNLSNHNTSLGKAAGTQENKEYSLEEVKQRRA